MEKPDQIATEILRSKFDAIVAEMQATLVSTAYSAPISSARECASALFTETGKLVAVDNPLYMYSMAMTAANVIDRFQYDMSGEDILVCNDPYGGGTRLQSFTIIVPVVHGDAIVLYLGVSGHTEDVGGDMRGNFNPRATELWAEGIRCPPVKVYRDGKLRKDMLETLCLNSRNPNAFRLDLEAMIAAANVGRRRIAELFEQYGAAVVLAAADWVLEYSRRRSRALIDRLPGGRYEGQCLLAHDCQGHTKLAIKVAVTIGDQRVVIDFSGTDPQTTSFVNGPLAATSAFAVLALLVALGSNVPRNAGFMDTVEIIAPEGTLVNPRYPAPIGWAMQHPGHEIAAAVLEALRRAVPDLVSNMTANTPLLFAISHQIRHGHTVEQTEFIELSHFTQGGCDGAHGRDGWGMPGIAAHVPLPSIELYETGRGGRVEKFEYVVDSSGAGAFRGGPATEAVVVLPKPSVGELHLTACLLANDGRGELQSRSNSNAIEIMIGNTTTVVQDVLIDRRLDTDARIAVVMGGGRGWGHPYDRPAELVRMDVLNGVVSLEAARRDYGVVLDRASLSIMEAETQRQRAERRAATTTQ
jgi:N-methylhydantoinase B